MIRKDATGITTSQKEGLGNLIDIGLRRGMEVLNSLAHSQIVLGDPGVEIAEPAACKASFPWLKDENLSEVWMKYRGEFTGSIGLVVPTSEAAHIASRLLGEDAQGAGMDELRSGILQEIGNVVLNAIMGTISNAFSFTLKYSLPVYLEGDSCRTASWIDPRGSEMEDLSCLAVTANFSFVHAEAEGTLLILLELERFDDLVKRMDAHD